MMDDIRQTAMCNGLQSKPARTAINAFLGPNYLPLSPCSGQDYLQLRLQSTGSDCNQRRWDHIICNLTPSPFSARPSWRWHVCAAGELSGGPPVSYAS